MVFLPASPRLDRRPLAHSLTAARILAKTAAFVVLPPVLLNNARDPFLWIGTSWSAAAALCAWEARGRWAKVAWTDAALVCALFVAVEAWCLLTPATLQAGGARLEYPVGYFAEHPILGYGPRPDSQARIAQHAGDDTLYSVSCTFGPHGLRSSPAPVEADGAVVFFGGSYTFGEGLEDEETVAWRVAEDSASPVAAYNFGFHGYGPHQMLAALQAGMVEDIVEQRPRHVIYTAIPDHLLRAAGLVEWDRQGPRYVVDGRGRARASGRFDQSLVLRALRLAFRSRAFRTLVGDLPWWERRRVELFAAIVDESRTLLQRRYPGCSFDVLLWNQAEGWPANAMQEALEERSIQVHGIREILPDFPRDPAPYQLNAHDRHPSARANREIAAYIRERIIDRKTKRVR